MFATSVDRVVSFGPLHLHLNRQLLLEGERPLRVGSRAMEMLVALVERAAELVGKDELMTRVWPNTTVEEPNIKVHIAALKTDLGRLAGREPLHPDCSPSGLSFRRDDSPVEVTCATSASSKLEHSIPHMPTRPVGHADGIELRVEELPPGLPVAIRERHMLLTHEALSHFVYAAPAVGVTLQVRPQAEC